MSYSTKERLVKVNSDKTVSFLPRGRPSDKTVTTYISGEPLKALKAGGTVKVDNRNASGFRIITSSASSY